MRISYIKGAKENVYITRTNSTGEYVLDIADLTSSYADADKIRVYCEWNGKITWQDFNLELEAGAREVNFALHKHSGLIDGCKKSVDAAYSASGTHHLGTGLKPGLKGMGRDEGWF